MRVGCKEGRAQKDWCFVTVVLAKTLESPLENKGLKPVNPKGNGPNYSLEGLMLKLKLQYLATWCEGLTHWKRPWCWERLKAGGEGNNRGWDGWMASPTQWVWVWVNSGSWWWTGKPGVLHTIGSQRVGHDWVIFTSSTVSKTLSNSITCYRKKNCEIKSQLTQQTSLLFYFKKLS